jgi:acyl-CoA hydrolase
MSEPLKPRTVQQSMTEMTEIVLPPHANALGTIFGGTVMSWIDVCGAIVSQRHCGRIAVTAFVDDLEFLAPIRVGDVVCLSGRLNAVFRSSMEVEVIVEREDVATGVRTLCLEALLVFVNVDDQGRPQTAPPLTLETEEDHRRSCEAMERKRRRQERKRSRSCSEPTGAATPAGR